jgi:HicA toxin of bacterial toxin-antitoxin,
MTRHAKLLARLLTGAADESFRFDDLCNVLQRLGFEDRQRGSHRIFWRDGVAEILNLQPRGGGQAKPYQVRQVRDVLLKYKLVPPAGLDPDSEASDDA